MASRKLLHLEGSNGSTIVVQLVNLQYNSTKAKPFYVQVRDPKTGQILYERTINKQKILINLPHAPEYVSLIIVGKPRIESTLITPLRKPNIPFDKIPETKRKYSITDFRFVANPNLTSPARMFTEIPVIEYNPILMQKHTEPVQKFIIYHEFGHYFFDNEILTDRWAINTFLNDGYNMSSANYGLTHVLNKESPDNIERMKAGDEYLQQIGQTYYNSVV